MDYTFKSSGPKTRPERVKPVAGAVDHSPAARSRASSTASTASFASAVEAQHEHGHPVRFPADEEAQMVEASHGLKAAANKQFAGKDYSSAISTYDKALAELPAYLDYELAVLQSNIAACHVQLKEWKEAVESAERGLDSLERELPTPKPKADQSTTQDKSKQPTSTSTTNDDDDSKIIELPDDQDDEQTTQLLATLNLSDQRKADITRIRSKLLLRRARAKIMLCDPPPAASAPQPASHLDPDNPTTPSDPPRPPKPDSPTSSHWSNLTTALSDYQTLASPPYFQSLPASDQKTVLDMLRTLPPRVEAAKKAEVDEMMGKLKQLGNGILKPFGLSTDMFKMVQDPGTGGWSMNFDQKAGTKG